MTLPNQTDKPPKELDNTTTAHVLDEAPTERPPVDSPPAEAPEFYATAAEARAAREALRTPAPPRDPDEEDIPF